MSCTVGSQNVVWEIKPEDIEKVYPLLSLDYESSGKIYFEKKDNKMKAQTVTTKSINKGESDSVMTPMGSTTYHTHPNSCYVGEKVIWGWPSGEDIAQTMVWALGGNLIHIVFTVEGPYVMEVNPCFVVFMKSAQMDDTLRGALFHWIQELGRSTHGLRTVDVNRKCKIGPDDWVKFMNSLFVTQKKNNPGKRPVISCTHPRVFSQNKLVRQEMGDYLKMFGGSVVKFPGITAEGNFHDSEKKMSVKDFVKLFEKITSIEHSFKCG